MVNVTRSSHAIGLITIGLINWLTNAELNANALLIALASASALALHWDCARDVWWGEGQHDAIAKEEFLGQRVKEKDEARLTLQRRETTVHDEFQIAQLALSQNNSREGLGLSAELLLAGSIAGKQVLEDTTVRSVGHCVRVYKGTKKKEKERVEGNERKQRRERKKWER